jgi:hypothetical protein
MIKAILPAILLLTKCLIGYAQSDDVLLRSAYNMDSQEKLKQFLERWQQENKAIIQRQNAALNDTFRAAQKIFSEFYCSIEGDDLERDSSFYKVIQDRVKVFVSPCKLYYTNQQIDSFFTVLIEQSNSGSYLKKMTKSNDGKFPQAMYDNFEPVISLDDNAHKECLTGPFTLYNPPVSCSKNLLYNDPIHFNCIKSFLESNNESLFGEKFYANARVLFLKKWVHLTQLRDLGLGLELVVTSITLDPSLSQARIDYSTGAGAGEAFLTRESDSWKIKEFRLTSTF